jgi:hypothetical protein
MTVKTFNLGWDIILFRYYLMMLVVIVGVLTQTWALALIGFPLFLSGILGVSFAWNKTEVSAAKMVSFNKIEREEKKVS